MTKPPEVGDCICHASATRNGTIYKVIEVDINEVKVRVYSEIIGHTRRFYKTSKQIYKFSHTKIVSEMTNNIKLVYDKEIEYINKIWAEGHGTLP